MSRNGVYLDNQRIPPKKSLQLRPFSHIYTGGFHLIFWENCLQSTAPIRLPRRFRAMRRLHGRISRCRMHTRRFCAVPGSLNRCRRM